MTGHRRSATREPHRSEGETPTIHRTKWFAIPAEYGDIDRSGLRVTIHCGRNTYYIDMK